MPILVSTDTTVSSVDESQIRSVDYDAVNQNWVAVVRTTGSQRLEVDQTDATGTSTRGAGLANQLLSISIEDVDCSQGGLCVQDTTLVFDGSCESISGTLSY